MLRKLVLGIAILASAAAADPKELPDTAPKGSISYSFIDRYDKDVDDEIRAIFPPAHKELRRIVGSINKSPQLVRIKDGGRAHINVYVDTNKGGLPAQVNEDWNTIHWYASSTYHTYTKEQKEHILTHELLHTTYKLPDEYPSRFSLMNLIKPHCVMGDFFKHGWSGKLCKECKATVKEKVDQLPKEGDGARKKE